MCKKVTLDTDTFDRWCAVEAQVLPAEPGAPAGNAAAASVIAAPSVGAVDKQETPAEPLSLTMAQVMQYVSQGLPVPGNRGAGRNLRLGEFILNACLLACLRACYLPGSRTVNVTVADTEVCRNIYLSRCFYP